MTGYDALASLLVGTILTGGGFRQKWYVLWQAVWRVLVAPTPTHVIYVSLSFVRLSFKFWSKEQNTLPGQSFAKGLSMPCNTCGGIDHQRRSSRRCSGNAKNAIELQPEVEPLSEVALPTEVKQKLALFLPVRECTLLGATNKAWRRALITDDCWWKMRAASTFGTTQPLDAELWSWRTFYISEAGRRCLWCRSPCKDVDYLSNERVCFRCQKTSLRYEKVTATRAKAEYRITETDLSSLRCLETQNPHYRSAAPMRLYLSSAVQKLSLQKHGSSEELVKKKRKASEVADKRAATKKRKMEERRAELESALEAGGLELRGDSRRCQDYIAGKRGFSLEQVVATMDKMHVVHDHSIFEEILSNWKGDGYIPRDEWECLKSDAENEAFRLYERAKNGWEKTPECDRSAASLCSCGRPRLPVAFLRAFIEVPNEYM